MKRNILVTGGAGFIGSNLADQLVQNSNNEIVVVDNFDNYYPSNIKEKNIEEISKNKNYTLKRIDICNKEEIEKVFEEFKFDIVIHLAGIGGVRNSIENPLKYHNINCMGTINILEAMQKNKVKNIIVASSSSVYGNCTKTPFKEEYACNEPISPYAATKKEVEMLLHVYHNIYGINVITNRFFTVYGRRQRPDLAISKFTKCILENKAIPFYGDGTTRRDYTFIEDIISGIEKGIEYLFSHENIYEIINIGSGNPINLDEMVKCIEKALNKKAIIQKMPMQSGDVQATYADISKAKKLLGYEPKYKFEDGIKKFVEWYVGEYSERY